MLLGNVADLWLHGWYRRQGSKEETFLARRRSISVSQIFRKLLIVPLARARQPLGTLYPALNNHPPPPPPLPQGLTSFSHIAFCLFPCAHHGQTLTFCFTPLRSPLLLLLLLSLLLPGYDEARSSCACKPPSPLPPGPSRADDAAGAQGGGRSAISRISATINPTAIQSTLGTFCS